MSGAVHAARGLSRPAATGIGFLAILSWALLALFTVGSGAVPPFLLSALCFGIGGAVGVAVILTRGGSLVRAFAQPARVWALGVGGIFGYHFFYFTALRNAPPADASLIAYLWPLLIVLFSGLLPGERLRPLHVVGAVLGLIGAGLIVTKGGSLAFDARYALGYAAAGACALIWSSYSVLSRRVGAVPTDVVAGFCLLAAALAVLCHLVWETTVWPQTPLEWTAVVALGLGPVGGAFYVWDVGVKHGDIQLLGVASYAAPLLSTAVLIAVGIAAPTRELVGAAVLIVCGAALAAWASSRRPRRL
ncbi:MAG: DMT family transporter [Pseudomonadota bacterium]